MDSLVPFISGILMTASATSMTGGVQASGGEQVVTGDGYSSVRVENVINAGTSGGTSYTKVETNSNGVVQVEEKQEAIAPGSSVRVHVATSTITNGTNGTAVRATASSSVVLQTAATSSSSSETRSWRVKITEQISKFFVQVFGWFGFTR